MRPTIQSITSGITPPGTSVSSCRCEHTVSLGLPEGALDPVLAEAIVASVADDLRTAAR